jgi:hypothetical protein
VAVEVEIVAAALEDPVVVPKLEIQAVRPLKLLRLVHWVMETAAETH